MDPQPYDVRGDAQTWNHRWRHDKAL
jgi:hypothetical protein